MGSISPNNRINNLHSKNLHTPLTTSFATTTGLNDALAAAKTPDLRPYLPNQSMAGTTPEMQAVEQFQKSLSFIEFKKSMRDVFMRLHETTTEPNGQAYKDSAWAQLEHKMELGVEPPPSDRPYRTELLLMYQETCKQLMGLSIMAEWVMHPKTPITEHKRGAFVQMLKDLAATEITVCGPGVITNIAAKYQEIHQLLLPVSLQERFEQQRVSIARNIIAHHTKTVFEANNRAFLAGNHIHIVNALQKELALEFKLPEPPEDKFASSDYVHDMRGISLNNLKAWLKKGLSPANIAKHLASQVLEEIHQRCDPTQPDWHHAFNTAREALTAQYGEINPFSVCRIDPETQIPIGLQQNPTLLAIDFLKKVAQLQPDKKLQPINWQDDLIWLESQAPGSTEVENHLIEFKLFDDASLKSLMQSTKPKDASFVARIMHECFRNIHEPITNVFRHIDFSKNPTSFWVNAIRMTMLNWPENQAKPYPGNAWDLKYTEFIATPEQDLALNINHPDLETWFDVNHFKQALKALPILKVPNLLDIQPSSQNTLGNQNMKLLEAALSLFKNNPEYNPHVALDNALKTKIFKAVKLVLAYWPDESPPPNTTQIEQIRKDLFKKTNSYEATLALIKNLPIYDANLEFDHAFMTGNLEEIELVLRHWPDTLPFTKTTQINQLLKNQICEYAPNESLIKILIEKGATYPPFEPFDPYSSKPMQGSKDLLYLAVIKRWVNVLDMMLNKNCLPSQWSDYHDELITNFVINSRTNLEQKQALGLKLLSIQDKLGYRISPDSNLTYFFHSKNNGFPILAAQFLKRSGHLNTITDNGHTHLQKAVLANNIALVKALVDAGADINKPSGKAHIGKTALHMAYRANNTEMIQLLERFGANTFAKDNKGRLPCDLKPTQTKHTAFPSWLTKINLRAMR